MGQGYRNEKKVTYTFVDETKMIQKYEENDKVLEETELTYKVENGELYYRYDDKWNLMNLAGDINQLKVKHFFGSWEKDRPFVEPGFHSDLQFALRKLELNSLNELTNPNDSILICNIYHIYRP